MPGNSGRNSSINSLGVLLSFNPFSCSILKRKIIILLIAASSPCSKSGELFELIRICAVGKNSCGSRLRKRAESLSPPVNSLNVLVLSRPSLGVSWTKAINLPSSFAISGVGPLELWKRFPTEINISFWSCVQLSG